MGFVVDKSLRVFSSRRTEDLVVDMLAFADDFPLTDPMSPELIVVPSWGMERWLSLAMAQRARLQLAANYQFLFPGKAVSRLVKLISGVDNAGGATLGDLDSDPWLRPGIIWAILEALPKLINDPDFEPVATYLNSRGWRGAAVGRKEYQLAKQIAALLSSTPLSSGLDFQMGQRA